MVAILSEGRWVNGNTVHELTEAWTKGLIFQMGKIIGLFDNISVLCGPVGLRSCSIEKSLLAQVLVWSISRLHFISVASDNFNDAIWQH